MGQKMIDPETGLELDVLNPAPVSWGRDSVRGRAESEGNPFLQAAGVTPEVMSPPTAAAAEVAGIPTQAPTMGGSGGALRPSSLLDKVLFTVFGTPHSMMTGEEESAAHADTAQAAAMSKSAAENPGEAHMGIPSASGKSLGESLDFLPSLMKMLGVGA